MQNRHIESCFFIFTIGGIPSGFQLFERFLFIHPSTPGIVPSHILIHGHMTCEAYVIENDGRIQCVGKLANGDYYTMQGQKDNSTNCWVYTITCWESSLVISLTENSALKMWMFFYQLRCSRLLFDSYQNCQPRWNLTLPKRVQIHSWPWVIISLAHCKLLWSQLTSLSHPQLKMCKRTW